MENVPKQAEQIFEPISGQAEVTIIKSMCVNCEEQGITKILPTIIPFYGDIILCSFSCDQCGYQNNEVMQAGIKQRGVKLILKVLNERDLNRGILTSEYSVLKIYELEFEIPKNNQKGQVTTFEGILQKAFIELSFLKFKSLKKHKNRRIFGQTELMNEQISLSYIRTYDPSGNAAIESFIVNYPQLVRKDQERSIIQLREMGYLDLNLPDLQQLELEIENQADSMVF